MAESAEEIVADGAMSVPAAVKFVGLGRTELYERMKAGTLAYVKCGSRRLIPKRALQAILKEGLVMPARAGEI